MELKNDKARRERGRNFTKKEKEIAITVIDRYRRIVENKATDGSSIKQRNDAWLKIVEEYNATAVSAPRTAKQLKVLWSNLRRIAKKTVAETNKRKYLDQDENIDENLEVLKQRKMQDKKNMCKTGGGQYETQLSEVGARVLAMIEPQTRPLPNIYDDDNIYHEDLILSPTRGAVLTTPPSPTYSFNSEPGPSHINTFPNPEPEVQVELEELVENPYEPVTFVPSLNARAEPSQLRRKKYIPPKQKTRKTKKLQFN